ncbi:MAG: hypothetical protein IJ324_00115 [Lachnospiraceae bacterium]|nr:hypothetical protein [Lachnospiraceae bacterium]
MKIQKYEDYKYVMSDTSFVYLGAKYTYEELIENEDVPFKLRTILERYIMPEISGDTTLEEHFNKMSQDLAFKTYRQLKVKLKINRPDEKKNLFGKVTRRYITETIPVADYVKLSPERKVGIVIQEVVFGKLTLMTFAV